MNAKELMIGDWIADKNKPHKVSAKDLHDMDVFPIYEDLAKPIRLTRKIFELNGWKLEHDKHNYLVLYKHTTEKYIWFMWDLKYRVIDIQTQASHLDLDKYNLCVTKVCVPCDYVHQFQHSLRLSGFTEMADNFKVE